MTDTEIIDGFRTINVWQHGGQRAPHKALLLLLALARVQRGEGPLMAYTELAPRLRELLDAFGPPRGKPRPEYPFWRLLNDGLWTIPEADQIREDLTAAGDAKVSTLKRLEARGGFPDALHATLAARPELVNQLAELLLDASLPSSLHQDVLDAVGMPWVAVAPAASASRQRDPKFREHILDIYEHRCAVCGYDGRLGQQNFGLEAAHIKWHAAGGPDEPDNGLALCVFHHRAFDRGALGIDINRSILVSIKTNGGPMIEQLLHRYAGQPLRGPIPGEPVPADEHIRWHQEQVFHAPARQSPT